MFRIDAAVVKIAYAAFFPPSNNTTFENNLGATAGSPSSAGKCMLIGPVTGPRLRRSQ